LVRPIRSFNCYVKLIPLFLVLYVLPFLFNPDPLYPGEILTPKDLTPELIRKIEDAVESFQKPLKKEEYQGIVSKTDEEARKALNQNERSEGESCFSEGFATIYYFFSFSMPEEVILRAMRDAVKINRECRERVTLVLRGFIGNDLKATISHLYKYLQKIGEDIPVEVDPELFERFNVIEVPQILKVKPVLSEVEGDDDTGLIKGDLVNLSYAISRFKEGLKDYGLYGRVYPIREEDILKVFASKQKEIEERLKERLPEIRKKMLVLTKYDGNFEHAKEERVYYINPKLILTEDIYDHQGNILLREGMVFDPTKYVELGRYVIIDGNSQKQVEFALKGDFKKIILISGDLEKLVKTYQRPFYFANDELIGRFKIKRVPAVIEREGEYVRVTEKAL
jgi:conjugal transfer pilus assembly protein TraW